MIYVSEAKTTAPEEFKTPLQQKVYELLAEKAVPFQRVDCEPAITMEDCIMIDERLQMKTVKTLFLCNRQQTRFYLAVTTADKPFVTKDFSAALGVSRVSFAPVELLNSMVGTAVGAATIFGLLLDGEQQIRLVIDKEVLKEEWYGCSDGTTTSYLRLPMDWVMREFIPLTGHTPQLVEL